MKYLYILILCIVLISCKSKEKEYTKDNEFIEMSISDENDNIKEFVKMNIPKDNNSINEYFPIKFSTEESIDIEFDIDWKELPRLNDDDMKKNITIIYRDESSAIENINEIEPNQKVIDILNKPFEKIELSITSEYSNKILFNGINELLNIFEINISQNMVDKFISIELYKNIRIKIENISIYVYRQYNEYFKLFFIEYDNDLSYEPKIKIEYDKTDIINILGNPSAYSDDRNIFIYISNKTLRQINIFFDNENVKLVQLISWGGI
jgi:hypothetical protein